MWNLTFFRKARALLLRIDYRHPLTLVIVVAAIVCLFGVATLAAWKTYQDRPMRKSYPVISLPEIGLKASLRTERVDDNVQYIFHAKPLSGATKDRLNEVIEKRSRESLRFFVALDDDAGFELCQTIVEWHPMLGGDGKTDELTGKGNVTSCPVSRYAQSSKWSITFSYPLLAENLSPEIPKSIRQEAGKHDEQIEKAHIPVAAQDTLTGADVVSGGVETLSGHSFRVTREAEKMTLIPWEASDKLAISCTQSACLITDNNNGQSVHARLIR